MSEGNFNKNHFDRITLSSQVKTKKPRCYQSALDCHKEVKAQGTFVNVIANMFMSRKVGSRAYF
jgi:hypothetical protein